jgi:hypothetical protein
LSRTHSCGQAGDTGFLEGTGYRTREASTVPDYFIIIIIAAVKFELIIASPPFIYSTFKSQVKEVGCFYHASDTVLVQLSCFVEQRSGNQTFVGSMGFREVVVSGMGPASVIVRGKKVPQVWRN